MVDSINSNTTAGCRAAAEAVTWSRHTDTPITPTPEPRDKRQAIASFVLQSYTPALDAGPLNHA